MQLKTGASIKEVKWQMFAAAIAVERVLNKYGYDCIITSGTDGAHGDGPSIPGKADGTLHDDGLALDFRSKHIPVPERAPLAREIKAELGDGYDVVNETKPPHFHIEWDPK